MSGSAPCGGVGGVKCRDSRVIVKQYRPVGQRFHFLTELSEILNNLFTVFVGEKSREWILFLYSVLLFSVNVHRFIIMF